MNQFLSLWAWFLMGIALLPLDFTAAQGRLSLGLHSGAFVLNGDLAAQPRLGFSGTGAYYFQEFPGHLRGELIYSVARVIDGQRATEAARTVVELRDLGYGTHLAWYPNFELTFLGGSLQMHFSISRMGMGWKKWDIQPFVGAGLYYQALRYDALNADGQPYNFAEIVSEIPASSENLRKLTRRLLSDTMDGDYETYPSRSKDNPYGVFALGGLDLVHHLTRRVDLHLRYQYILPSGKTDDFLDGFQYTASGFRSLQRDDIHYVSLGFSYRFGRVAIADPIANAVKFQLADSDRDGILDKNDQCPFMPGPAETAGCPWGDRDRDGIRDDVDQCPDIPGTALSGGCPLLDSDYDGITDNIDRCPGLPGPLLNEGCPLSDSSQLIQSLEAIADVDHDGVPDAIDQCPDIAGSDRNNGCPVEVVSTSQRFFPLVPPAPSVKMPLPPSLFRNLNTLDDYRHRLKLALLEAGYHTYQVLPFEPNETGESKGFAVICQTEQIRSDASPVDGPERWKVQYGSFTEEGLNDFLDALGMLDRGYFRMIVFLVGDLSSIMGDISYPLPASQRVNVGSGGTNGSNAGSLQDSFQTVVWIYEFEKGLQSERGRQVIPGLYGARTHLWESKIWQTLQRLASSN